VPRGLVSAPSPLLGGTVAAAIVAAGLTVGLVVRGLAVFEGAVVVVLVTIFCLGGAGLELAAEVALRTGLAGSGGFVLVVLVGFVLGSGVLVVCFRSIDDGQSECH
jgi:hypothetical protein